jgi:CheY-like chemotaxis protein
MRQFQAVGSTAMGSDSSAARLLVAAQRILGELDAEVVYRRVLESARELTGAEHAALGLLPERGDAAAGSRSRSRFISTGLSAEQLLGLEGPLGGVAGERGAIRSLIGTPVFSGTRQLANLYVIEKRDGGEFSARDEDELIAIAALAGTAIANALRSCSGERDRRGERTVEAQARETTQDHTRERGQDASGGSQDASGGSQGASGGTILVVEDEPALRRLMQRILEAQRYTVLTAGRPSEAQLLVDRHGDAIELLITDVILPEGRGPELAAALRSRHGKLAVLYVSGYGPDATGLPAGAAFLGKPFTPQQLLGAVDRALAERGVVAA